jgi:hypothetical protein
MDDFLQVHCPIFLLTSSEPCWKCGAVQTVNAIGTHALREGDEELTESGDTSELFLLSNITDMPLQVFKYVAQRNHRYMQRHSRTAGESYYANTCECGANFGDFYLFSEPGGAFFPDTDEAAGAIEIEPMPFSGTLSFAASYSTGIGEYILQHAKRGAA